MGKRVTKDADYRERYGMSEAALNELATYNAEVNRGIMHTPTWEARMEALQRQFIEAQSKRLMAEMSI